MMLGELTHQRTALFGQSRRRQHLELVEEVARRLFTASRNSEAFDSQHGTALTVGRNFKRNFAHRRRGDHLGSQHRLVIPYGKLTAHIAPADGENFIWFDSHGQIKVAVKFGCHAPSALPFEANAGAVCDAGRNGDLERAPAAYHSCPAAARASASLMKHPQPTSAFFLDHHSAASARPTFVLAFHVNSPGRPLDGFFERYLDFRVSIRGALGSLAALGEGLKRRKVEAARTEAEKAFEKVAEPARRSSARLMPCVAPPKLFLRDATLEVSAQRVVLFAFFGIAKNLVCFVDFLKFLLSFLVARIYVGMVLAGELAVGGFDFFGGCVAVNA